MPKFKHLTEPPRRHLTPLPPERLAEIGFVYDGRRVIAPWPRGALTWGREHDLLAVLAKVDAVPQGSVVWLWPDDRPPVPVQAENLYRWLTTWAQDRASYQAR